MRLLQVLLFFLWIFIINSCTSYDDSPLVYPEGWNATDTTNGESLPRRFTLLLGESVRINSAGVTINFSAIYKASSESYQVVIHYYYDNSSYEIFYVNSDALPAHYILKSIPPYKTTFTKLQFLTGLWHLEIEYNRYFNL